MSDPEALRKPAETSDEVAALARGIAVLRAVADADASLGNSELAALTGIPKATVSRLAATLVKAGLLKQFADSELFTLGPGTLDLGNAYLRKFDLRSRIRPYLVTLAECAASAVHVGVLDGLDIVLIETVRPRSAMLQTRLDVGMRLSLLTSAIGRAYLGGLAAAEREALIERACAATCKGRAQCKKCTDLATRLAADAQARGYALSMGDWHPAINGIGAPFRGPSGEPYAISCGGPAHMLSETELVDRLVPELLACVEKIGMETRAVAARLDGAGAEVRAAR